MGIRIRYMGNKHGLAGDVASIVEGVEGDRPFLDLFCGMCSVGSAVAASGRPVWGNDVQFVASLVARLVLAESDAPPLSSSLETALEPAFERNRMLLRQRFASELREEAGALSSPDPDRLRAVNDAWQHAGSDPSIAAEVQRLSKARNSTPYRLCTLTFANGYFGLSQAIDLDSLRYAIDRARARGALSAGQAKWALVALLQTASVVASTPGHFAQFLHPSSESAARRIVRQRRREVWQTFLTEAGELQPLGNADWRSNNRVFRRDALKIWPTLRSSGFAGGIIYADPPYSADHYSRYYHVLETLLRYDYPSAAGRGRYRPDRFVTPFSIKSQVRDAFDTLFAGAAQLKSTLILSYPASGLLVRRGGDPGVMLREHFTSVELALRRAAQHSTLGARHGSAANSVDELIWVAR